MENLLIQKEYGKEIYYRKLGEHLYSDFYIFENEGNFGIINSNFIIIVPPKYDELKSAFPKHFWGKSKGFWQLYDFDLKPISNQKFAEVDVFFNRFANVSLDGEQFGFINRKAEFVIEPKFGKGSFLGLKYFLISDGDKFAVIDIYRNMVIPFSDGEKPDFSRVVQHILKRRKPLKEWLRLRV